MRRKALHRSVIDKPRQIRYSIWDGIRLRPALAGGESVCAECAAPAAGKAESDEERHAEGRGPSGGRLLFHSLSLSVRQPTDRAGDPGADPAPVRRDGLHQNYVARSMVMRRTELIGLVVPSIDNQFMAELAYHAEMSARARGYNLMLCNSGPDLRQEKAVVKLLVGRQVDGMLIVPQEHRSCEELRVYTEQVPTVFLSEDLRDEPLSCVTTDNTGATYLAMEYLRSLGHREILYFGRRHTVTHQLRAEGYLRACRDMGLTPRIVDSSFPRSSVAGGYELARELFTKPLDYTAILASTDSNALGILRAADELGIRVPEQLSLMGFDNIASAAMPRIDLTTVEQSKREMALQAVEILLDKIERGTQGYVHQILMPSLVKRSSCRALT